MLRKSESAAWSDVPGVNASSSASRISLSPLMVSKCFRIRTSGGWSAAIDSFACKQSDCQAREAVISTDWLSCSRGFCMRRIMLER